MDIRPEMDINLASQSQPASIQPESQTTTPSDSHQKESELSHPCDDAAKAETGSIMTDNLGDQEVLSNQDTINYRTCSWQKVGRRDKEYLIFKHLLIQSIFADGRLAIFRIHLHSHYVVSLVIFGSWAYTWAAVDAGYRDDSALYIVDNMVRLAIPDVDHRTKRN
jgi:hypothetical protein